MLLNVTLVVGAAAVLMFSADRLVSYAGGTASRIGISPVIIGAVVIGFGSSLPEMLVSLAALDQPNGLDLAVGNVVGSIIANIGLVLGFSVLFFPFAGSSTVIRREGALMLVGLLLMSFMLWDQRLEAWEGMILTACLIGSGFVVVIWSRGEPETTQEITPASESIRRLFVGGVISLVGLAVAA